MEIEPIGEFLRLTKEKKSFEDDGLMARVFFFFLLI